MSKRGKARLREILPEARSDQEWGSCNQAIGFLECFTSHVKLSCSAIVESECILHSLMKTLLILVEGAHSHNLKHIRTEDAVRLTVDTCSYVCLLVELN